MTNSTLVRLGKNGWNSRAGPSEARSASSAGSSRKTAQCGLPMDVAVIRHRPPGGLERVVDHRRSRRIEGHRHVAAAEPGRPQVGDDAVEARPDLASPRRPSAPRRCGRRGAGAPSRSAPRARRGSAGRCPRSRPRGRRRSRAGTTPRPACARAGRRRRRRSRGGGRTGAPPTRRAPPGASSSATRMKSLPRPWAFANLIAAASFPSVGSGGGKVATVRTVLAGEPRRRPVLPGVRRPEEAPVGGQEGLEARGRREREHQPRGPSRARREPRPARPGVLAAVEPVLPGRVEEGPQPHEVAHDLRREAGRRPASPHRPRNGRRRPDAGAAKSTGSTAKYDESAIARTGPAGRPGPGPAKRAPSSLVTRSPRSQATTSAGPGHSRRCTAVPESAVGCERAPAVPRAQEPVAGPGEDGRVGERPARQEEAPDALRERHRRPGLAEVLRDVEAAVAAQPDLVGERARSPARPRARRAARRRCGPRRAATRRPSRSSARGPPRCPRRASGS